MIQFTPERRPKPTFFFFDKKNEKDLYHVLRDNLVTGWAIYPLSLVAPVLPAGTEIPNVYPDALSQIPTAPQAVSVMISYYDAGQLEKFLWEVLDHPETRARHQAEYQNALHQMRWEEKWANDPPPIGLAAGLTR